MHERGLSHGDLHPRNVVVDDAGTVFLLDFEMSAPLADDAPC